MTNKRWKCKNCGKTIVTNPDPNPNITKVKCPVCSNRKWKDNGNNNWECTKCGKKIQTNQQPNPNVTNVKCRNCGEIDWLEVVF